MLGCYLPEGLEREARALSESKSCENYSRHREIVFGAHTLTRHTGLVNQNVAKPGSNNS